MNTNLKNRKRVAAYLLLAVFALSPFFSANAQSDDEFGVWTTIEASKKINKKFKAAFEAEFRTLDGVGSVERYSLGARIDYKITKWLKANAGYIFIYNRKPSEKNIKDVIDADAGLYDYNVDDAYWTCRNRFHITVAGEYKIGRVEIGLRERLQYTRTNSATTDETKYRWGLVPPEYEVYEQTVTKEKDFKDSKENTTLRSRLTAKWDIPKCKINPFASVELYTRLDKWKGNDKLRYRIGASYKIDKDNSISLFYLYQDTNDDDEPKGHAIGIEYSIDL